MDIISNYILVNIAPLIITNGKDLLRIKLPDGELLAWHRPGVPSSVRSRGGRLEGAVRGAEAVGRTKTCRHMGSMQGKAH